MPRREIPPRKQPLPWSIVDAEGNVIGDASNPLAVLLNAPGAAYDVDAAITGTMEVTGDVSVLLGRRASKALTAAAINNAAASGDLTAVAASAGLTTKVYRLRLRARGACIITIKDGTTLLEAFEAPIDGFSVLLDLSDEPWYQTTANTALVINVSTAVQVDGVVEYIRN